MRWLRQTIERRTRPGISGGTALACVLVAVVFAPDVVLGQGQPSRQVIVVNREGKVLFGNLTSIAGEQLVVGTPEPQRLATKDVISLRFKNRPSVQRDTDPLILISDGSLLVMRVLASDDESLMARWARFPAINPIRLPLEAIRGIVLARPDDPVADAQLWNTISDHRGRHDLVLLGNGDTLVGRFAGLNEKALSLQTSAGATSVERSGISGVSFNPELINVERLKGEGALLSFVDGGRLRVQSLKLGMSDRFECRTAYGTVLEFPVQLVDAVRFLGGCVTYLSDLEPAEFRFEPFFDLQWPLRRDRNVQGGPLRLRGVAYPAGLGLHSCSDVTYNLSGQYRGFHATIGIDDGTHGKGSATFEVLVDGKSVYKSGELTGGNAAVMLDRVDITGCKSLKLRVDFGADADIQDHADWCDAVLIR
jgi:hypothetical protein